MVSRDRYRVNESSNEISLHYSFKTDYYYVVRPGKMHYPAFCTFSHVIFNADGDACVGFYSVTFPIINNARFYYYM